MSFDISDYVTRIDANRTLKDELMARLKESRPRQRISVTDLLNPRKAFMQRTHPEIQPTLERKEAMLAGKGFHDLFGHAVSTEEYLEQFVEWDGIVGVIDVFNDIPIEMKTTGSVSEREELRESRPAYVEQLAMYCAMVDRDKGRIILYGRESDDKKPLLAVYDASFDDLQAVKEEMGKRRDALAAALKKGDPENLPGCPWIGRGCEYKDVCGCSGVPEFVPTIAKATPPLKPNPDEAKRLLSMLSTSRKAERMALNDLVFPRKAYYDRLRKEQETDEDRLKRMDRAGFDRAFADAIEFGRGPESERKLLAMGDVQDRVTYLRGVPTILRTSKLNEVVSRESMTRMFSHYLVRLAFECALTGFDKGRLILRYEKLQGDSRLMVYDVVFKDTEALLKEAEGRLLTLREVREGHLDPKELPPCPQWMTKYCQYQPSCGC